MKTRTILFAFSALLAAVAVVHAGDEQTIRDLDAEWSKAAAAKDVDKTVSFYSDDAMVLAPNMPIATTKEAVRSIWKEFLTSPGASVSWKATKVEVAKSGDFAYVTGTYEDTSNDASGKPVKDHGKYLEILKKQADGTWKCVVDAWNSDTPVPAAEKK